ncbi:Uncharacterised protein [Weissella viridescens]|uniref:Uncharacterized protein n=1 Tax=Weissella viridescens TaxID=1629 RepID=A0A380P6K7_WEIVI|nr:Uncharacterised protein [Weissella viridescens]
MTQLQEENLRLKGEVASQIGDGDYLKCAKYFSRF